MAKSEIYNNPLIPIVLVAGILSGSLWRGGTPTETGKPGDPSTSGDKSDAASAPASWVSDLRPVLESLDGALGARAASAGASLLDSAAGITLDTKGAARDTQIRDAMVGLQTGLDPGSGLDTRRHGTRPRPQPPADHHAGTRGHELGFLKRLAVYGVLPLLAVNAALFPEVGGNLFGWLEPLRKLSAF